MDNLQKFCSRRNKVFAVFLIFLVFFKSGVQYLWQREISACKVLMPIKIVPVKNDHFLNPKFELTQISANEWVSVLAQFLPKIIRYIC